MILGNKLILNIINKSVKNKNFSHSYIISGDYGLGKKTIANYFAKSILCSHTPPCGVCQSCSSIDNKNNSDIIYVAPTTKKSLGVNDIRNEVIQKLHLKPYEHDYKIFIIDKCETMTIQAQNSLLKSIEEPPSYAIFLLLTENINNFLSTIVSRCITLKVKPVPTSDVFHHLINSTDVTEDTAKFLSFYSEGNIGVALDLINDDNFKTSRDKIIDYALSVADLNLVHTLKLVKSFDIFKDDIFKYLNILVSFYRDAIVFKETANEQFISNKDKMSLVISQSNLHTIKNLYKKLDAVITAKTQLNKNANFNLTIEVMLLKIKEK